RIVPSREFIQTCLRIAHLAGKVERTRAHRTESISESKACVAAVHGSRSIGSQSFRTQPVSTVTLNGKVQPTRVNEGPASTNNAGQVNDTVGLLAPARTAVQDKPLVQLLQTQAVTVTNKNRITF